MLWCASSPETDGHLVAKQMVENIQRHEHKHTETHNINIINSNTKTNPSAPNDST